MSYTLSTISSSAGNYPNTRATFNGPYQYATSSYVQVLDVLSSGSIQLIFQASTNRGRTWTEITGSGRPTLNSGATGYTYAYSVTAFSTSLLWVAYLDTTSSPAVKIVSATPTGGWGSLLATLSVPYNPHLINNVQLNLHAMSGGKAYLIFCSGDTSSPTAYIAYYNGSVWSAWAALTNYFAASLPDLTGSFLHVLYTNSPSTVPTIGSVVFYHTTYTGGTTSGTVFAPTYSVDPLGVYPLQGYPIQFSGYGGSQPVGSAYIINTPLFADGGNCLWAFWAGSTTTDIVGICVSDITNPSTFGSADFGDAGVPLAGPPVGINLVVGQGTNIPSISGTPPNGAVGVPYSFTWSGTYNTTSIISGSLPPGLADDGFGDITGTPTTPGSYTFTTLADVNANTTAKVLYFSVSLGGGSYATYSSTQSGSSWGSPASMLLSGAVVYGCSPTGYATQAWPLTVSVANPSSSSFYFLTGATIIATIVIPGGTLSISCAAPPVATGGVFYSHAFPATGGTPPYTFSIISGSLPPGLSLNTSTGVVSGTPAIPSICNVDAGGGVGWAVLPPAKDTGDSRANKQFGDMMIDYGTGATQSSPNAQILYDNLLINGVVKALPLSVQRTQAIIDLITPPQLADLPIIHRNVTPLITGCGPVILYEWQPSYLALPEDSTARPTNWQSGFSAGFKWINGVVIHADTYNASKTVTVEYDNQQTGATFTIQHNGEQRLPYYFPPIYAHEIRLVPTDDVPWHNWMDEQWLGNNEPEYGGALAVNWVNAGVSQFKWINGVKLHADTFGINKSIQIQYDGGTVGPIITLNHAREKTLPYYWSPIYAHQIRIVPLDNVPWRYWPDTEWLFNQEPEYGGALAVNWINLGVGEFKWVNGMKLHADSFGVAKSIQIQYDGGQIGPTITFTHTGEETLPYYWPPFYAHQIRIVPLDNVSWRYWPDTEWMFNLEPEYGAALAVNWISLGVGEFKWINGMKLHADSFGIAKKIQIQFDGGQIGPTITFTHTGEETLPYYWPPIYAHEIRIVPLDSNPWRYWPDTEWMFNQEPEYGAALAVNWTSGGVPNYKWVNGILLHADTFNLVKHLQIQFEGGTNPTDIFVQHNGEETLPYYFTPVYAHEMRILPMDAVSWRYWPDTTWLFNIEPEYGGALAVNWVNGGTPHYKFVQGIRLHADTFGQAKRVQILYEGGILGPVLTITHNGEETLPYTWSPPFKAHLMKIIPLDNVPWRYWSDTEWVYELEPELANYWISQPTALGQNGYVHAREIWVAYAGQSNGIVSAIVDGVLIPLATLLSSSSPVKQYFVCPPIKGKYWQLTASGTGLQIYERDCEFLVKSWGSNGPYNRVKPLGDTSGGGGSSGAKI